MTVASHGWLFSRHKIGPIHGEDKFYGYSQISYHAFWQISDPCYVSIGNTHPHNFEPILSYFLKYFWDISFGWYVDWLSNVSHCSTQATRSPLVWLSLLQLPEDTWSHTTIHRVGTAADLLVGVQSCSFSDLGVNFLLTMIMFTLTSAYPSLTMSLVGGLRPIDGEVSMIWGSHLALKVTDTYKIEGEVSKWSVFIS